MSNLEQHDVTNTFAPEFLKLLQDSDLKGAHAQECGDA